MPIQLPDTRIPLSGNRGAAADSGRGSPFQMLGALASLDAVRAQAEQRRAMAEQRQRDLEDDDAIRSTLPRYERPDEAIDDLYRQGRVSAAGKLSKVVADRRKQESDSYKSQVENTKSRLGLATNMLQGVTDDKTYQTVKRAVGETLEPVFGKGVWDQLPTAYDETTQPMFKAMLAWGTDRTEQLKADQAAIENAQKAKDLQLREAKDAREHEQNRREAYEHWMKAMSNSLSIAKDEGDWNNRKGLFVMHGAPTDILETYGPWGPGATEKARQLGLSGKEEADIAHQKVTEAQGARRVAEYESRGDSTGGEGGGTRGRGLTQNRVSEINEKAANEFQKIEDAMKLKVGAGKFTLDKMSPDDREYYGNRRLMVENQKRDALGWPHLEDVIQQHTESGNQKELQKALKIYEGLAFHPFPGAQPTTTAPASRPAASQPVGSGRGGGAGAAAPTKPATAVDRSAKLRQLQQLIQQATGEQDPAKRGELIRQATAIEAEMRGR